MQTDVEANGRSSRTFTPIEEETYLTMSRRPHIYEEFASSIAPAIYGNPDIKKAIACLLLSGSKKILPDGMRLRGDINVLLLGDPGTAKSQLLKFVEKVAPIGVYTSGKGSSAAGLTASVVRDPSTVGDVYNGAICRYFIAAHSHSLNLARILFGRWCHGISRWRGCLH